MGLIDTIILTVIVIGGLFIFYKALKEPLDLFFGLIKRGIESLKDRVSGAREDVYETISYGPPGG